MSIITSLYLNLFDCFLLSSIIFFTSINYWRYPIKGFRRNIDIIAVICSCIYQTFLALQIYLIYSYLYFLIILLCMKCYVNAIKQTDKKYSSNWHCCIHILANIANIVLYIGLYSNKFE